MGRKTAGQNHNVEMLMIRALLVIPWHTKPEQSHTEHVLGLARYFRYGATTCLEQKHDNIHKEIRCNG